MKKVKLLYLLLFILFTQYSYAQWPIPDAQQQPQWHMAFWFKDANGEMDTVYIGYDSTASKYTAEYDSNFEPAYPIDSIKFQARVFKGQPPYNLARKAEITSQEVPNFEISFINGKMPVTMYWSDSLFNSPDLPDKYFPDISPRPRARGDMRCSNGEPPYLYCHTGSVNYPFILSDHWKPEYSIIYVPQYADSFFFDGAGDTFYNPEKAITIYLEIVPHNYPVPVSIEEHTLDDSEFSVYPNPVKNTLQIEHNYTSPIQLQFSNLQGKVLHTNTYNNQTIGIDMSAYPSGMYFLQLIDEAGNSSVRQIIVE